MIQLISFDTVFYTVKVVVIAVMLELGWEGGDGGDDVGRGMSAGHAVM